MTRAQQTSDRSERPALPPIDTLTAEQVRGGACVWCAQPLTPGADVDLGVRQDPRIEYFAAWCPRSCRCCVGSRPTQEETR